MSDHTLQSLSKLLEHQAELTKALGNDLLRAKHLVDHGELEKAQAEITTSILTWSKIFTEVAVAFDAQSQCVELGPGPEDYVITEEQLKMTRI